MVVVVRLVLALVVVPWRVMDPMEYTEQKSGDGEMK